METALELVPLPAEQRKFGRYSLLFRIGAGGMANLYLARFTGPEGFEKLVAIKRIHEHLSAQPTFLKMFKDEARLAGRISHPNVVHVLELGEHRGYYYIAMEYVEGENLTALLNRTRLALPVAARIIADALAGLHAAHELRSVTGELVELVHRDLSPSNILIGYDGAVKVVDFGVARARGTLHTTEAGMVKGKFAYMSPEQVANQPLDRRSDIFSMGILLYEVSTYSRLFGADSEAGSVSMIQSGKIPPPSSRLPGYPPLLEKIVLRALSRKREARFASAREMQLALEEYIYSSGSPMPASRVGDLMRTVFADRIARKEQLLKESVGNLGVPGEPDLSTSGIGPAATGSAPEQSQPLPSGPRASSPPPLLAARSSAAVALPPTLARSQRDRPTVEVPPRTLGLDMPRLHNPSHALSGPIPRPDVLPPAAPDLDYEQNVVEMEADAPQVTLEQASEVTAGAAPLAADLRTGPGALIGAAATPAGSASAPVAETQILPPWFRARRWLLLGGGGALLLGGCLFGLVLGLRGGGAGNPGRSQPPPATVEVNIRVEPAEAQILVDGQPAGNPCRLRGAAGSGARVQVRAPGYRPRELRIAFERSRSLAVKLQPLAADVGATPRSPEATLSRPAPLPTVRRPRPRPGAKKAGSKKIMKGLFGNPYED